MRTGSFLTKAPKTVSKALSPHPRESHFVAACAMTKQVDVQEAVRRVRQEASAARAFFHTWNELNLARGDPRLRATMSDCKYVDFFHVSLAGNFRLMFLSLSSLFDRNSKALSLRAVSKALKNEGYVEVAYKVNKLYSIHKDTIVGIQHIRNKSIVHNDPVSTESVFGDVSITPNAIIELIDAVCLLLNEVLSELDFPNRISEGERNRRAVRSLLAALGGRHANHNDAV